MNVYGHSGHVFKDTYGRYLKLMERSTHTGHHVDFTFVESIDEADVFTDGHLASIQRVHGLTHFYHLTALPARAETRRVVTLGEV